MKERPDNDSPERYIPRHKWYPKRLHRGGIGGGDMDFMSDESLYKPSMLGYVCVKPAEVIAGTRHGLKLVFCTGPAGILEGVGVHFDMRGQRPLGCSFQTTTPDVPGFIRIHGPKNCELEAFSLGFRVKKGNLREGDTVTLVIKPFLWTPLAGKREFKVVVNYGSGIPEQRLPEPVVINVRPRSLHHVEATLSCSRRDNSPLRIHITTRDKFDNRVSQTGTVRLKLGDKTTTACIVDGLADCYIESPIDGPIHADVIHKESGLECQSNICIPSECLQLYIGDLHCHDFLSEAEGYTDQVYRWAIEDRNLDFISVPPQAHGWLDNETWTIAKYMNERYLNEGKFVTFLSFEWQHTGYGDKVIHFLGGDQPYLCVDDSRYNMPAKLYEALRTSDAIVISHHSSYPPGSWCSSTDFDTVETDVERLVELWSMHGSSEGYNSQDRPLLKSDPARNVMAALRKGLRLGFVAGSDSHSARPGGSAKEPLPYWGGLAAVWAESLTRRSIFSALYARRTYALTGARIILKMTVNGAFMGSEIPASRDADIRIDVWAPRKIRKVELIKNTHLLRKYGPFSNECHLQIEDKTQGSAFYHCRVVQEDGHLAVCSPIWIG